MSQSYGALLSLRAWHAQMAAAAPHAVAASEAAQHDLIPCKTATAQRRQQPQLACCGLPHGSAGPRLRQAFAGRPTRSYQPNSSRRGLSRRTSKIWAVGRPPPPPPPEDDGGAADGSGGGGGEGFGASEPEVGSGGGDLTPEEAARFGGGRDSLGRAQQGAELDGAPPLDPPPRPFRQRTRLAEALLAAPSRTDRYFDDDPSRRLLWLAIAFASGFYCANTVSLSFGTLAVNDVVAAAVTVGFCEVVSYVYHQAETVTYPLALLNSFKMGVIAALIADALKLQG